MITLEEKRLIHEQNLVKETTKKVRKNDLTLFKMLNQSGRLLDYERALEDESYMRELEAEFGLDS